MKLRFGKREAGVAKNRKGLTLIEVVIAMVILVVGLVSILTLFPVGLKAGRRSREVNQAALLAKRLLQEVQLAKVDDLLSGNFPNGQTGESGDFRWEFFAQNVSLEGVEGVPACSLWLKVEWEGEAGVRQEQWMTYLMEDS